VSGGKAHVLSRVLAEFASLDGLEAMPIETAREVNDREAAVMFGPVDEVGAIENRLVEGSIPVRAYQPQGSARGTLVYFHGGGWAVGGLESHDGVARFLCRHAGCTVVAVDYRLAPEHRFPAALDDAWAAAGWAFAQMHGPFAVGGDSSGGNLAAVVARRARDHGTELALQLLVYAALDLSRDSHWMRQYLGGQPADDPDASPLSATDLGGLAPALILSCGLDDLRPQADAYEQDLSRAGVEVRHLVYPDLIHGAYRMPAVLPGARRMLEDSAAGLARAFSAFSPA
jgi:acetyl esterase